MTTTAPSTDCSMYEIIEWIERACGVEFMSVGDRFSNAVDLAGHERRLPTLQEISDVYSGDPVPAVINRGDRFHSVYAIIREQLMAEADRGLRALDVDQAWTSIRLEAAATQEQGMTI